MFTVVDPGFPIGGADPFGGGGNLRHRCFSARNVCKTERMRSHGGWGGGGCGVQSQFTAALISVMGTQIVT